MHTDSHKNVRGAARNLSADSALRTAVIVTEGVIKMDSRKADNGNMYWNEQRQKFTDV
jgi:hypothetical protein